MTKKADFNAEEWSTVVEGPLLAGMRLVTASRGGTIRETIAMSKEYAKARQQQGESELLDDLVEQGESELLDDLVASPPALDAERVRATGDVAAASSERLREAVGLLEAKASPEEVEAYKRFTLSLAETVANAHKEGGFMGVGGKQVSDDERAALDDIASTLGVSPSSSG